MKPESEYIDELFAALRKERVSLDWNEESAVRVIKRAGLLYDRIISSPLLHLLDNYSELGDEIISNESASSRAKYSYIPVSYTHLTLPTICSV